MLQCSVCELNLSDDLPAFCPQCAWDIRNDPFFNISLDKIPQSYLDDWQQRRKIQKGLWEERKQIEQRAAEQSFWEVCRKRRTIQACNEYNRKYPNGLFVKESKNLIQQIQQAQEQNAETQFWQMHCQKLNAQGYEKYLKKYPNGRFAAEARKLLEKIKKENKEKTRTEQTEPKRPLNEKIEKPSVEAKKRRRGRRNKHAEAQMQNRGTSKIWIFGKELEKAQIKSIATLKKRVKSFMASIFGLVLLLGLILQ